jgi:hypothetical protein
VLTCTACPAHTTVLSNHTGCVCDSGCEGTWPGTCTNCPLNCPTNAEPSEGGTSCQCSYGFEATPGTSYAAGNLTCRACTGDTYTASGVTTCTQCPTNSVALGDNTGCQCSSGCQGTWPATCSSCDYSPVAPTLLSVEALSSSTLNVTWQTNQAGIVGLKVTTGYIVKCYQTTTNPTCSTEGNVSDVITASASAAQSTSVSGLSPNTQYTCFVTSYNTLGLTLGTCSSGVAASTLAA